MQAKQPQSAKTGKRPTSGGLEHVVLRSDFYRDGYRRMVVINLIAAVAILVETFILFTLVNRPVETRYFATENGRITQLQPLNTPVLSGRQLVQFAQEAAVASYTFDFVNYRKQLSELSSYYTRDGYSEYIDALSRSNLDIVTKRKYVVSAVASGAPVVTREGVKQGVYAWEVQMPMSVVYQSSAERADQKFVVKMLLVRMPTAENPKGVGVHQIILDESSSS
jgi:intracellular multiplication protein IcmL